MTILGFKMDKLKEKSTYKNYFRSLKYSLYILTHPLDGMWDLTHERRGSIAVANTIVILTLLARVWSLQYTSFQFGESVYWPAQNVPYLFLSILIPIAMWCVGNWGLTTLFDGKGTMKKIYMSSAYALTPYPLIQIPLIFISHGITEREGAFYEYFQTFSILWVAILLICAMMQVHEYTIGKTILCIIATVVAMLVILFILLLFFSLISQGISYFVSIYREIMFRIF